MTEEENEEYKKYKKSLSEEEYKKLKNKCYCCRGFEIGICPTVLNDKWRECKDFEWS